MTVTWQSSTYTPGAVVKRYVRLSVDGVYHFCEVNSANRDIRQGTVNRQALTKEIRDKAAQFKGQAYGYVEWENV